MESLILLDPDGARARLLAVAGIVQDRLPTAVLIGGLAVVCRCQRHGRVTQDVDTVIDESVQGVELANLGSLEADGHVWIDGVKVDVVGVDALDSATPLTELVAGGRQQLFVAAHRWALDHHQVVNVTTTHGKAPAVALRVAAPAALVATKTHALTARAASGGIKAGGDLVDVLALVSHHAEAVTHELTGAPYELGRLVGNQVGALLQNEERLNRVVLQARDSLPGLRPSDVQDALRGIMELGGL